MVQLRLRVKTLETENGRLWREIQQVSSIAQPDAPARASSLEMKALQTENEQLGALNVELASQLQECHEREAHMMEKKLDGAVDGEV